MKKLLTILFVILPILIIIAGVGLYFSINWIAKNGVETFGPKLTRTEVRLESSNISLFSGKGSLKGLFIGNPKGFKGESAFKVKEIKVAIDVSSILSDRLIIEEIVVNAPEISYEKGMRSSNIKTILNNVQALAGKSKREAKTAGKGGPEESQRKDEKKVQINNFIVKNGKVNMSATLLKGKNVIVSLGEIHLKNIGAGKDGKTASEVFEEIFGVMNTTISGSVAGLESPYSTKAKQTIEDVKDTLKKWFGK
ncbi:MAG: AsmA family protein [Deltaproteobacteria bacterium]|nr:AsmA family protein [Deltaproteobacteria bacterium]